jgi:hypothetical protein
VLREELEKRGLSKKGKQQELRARLADAGGLEEDTNASAETVDPNNIPTCRIMPGDSIFQLAVAFQTVLRMWVKERNQMNVTERIEMPMIFAEAAFTELVAVVNKKVRLNASVIDGADR